MLEIRAFSLLEIQAVTTIYFPQYIVAENIREITLVIYLRRILVHVTITYSRWLL